MTHEERAARLSPKEVAALLAEHDELTARCGDLECQVEWDARSTDAEGVTVGAHTRRSRGKEKDDESELRFDESVPVEEIRIEPAEIEPGAEPVSEKITCRLAQRPVSFVVLRFVRPVYKSPDGSLSCAAAPPGVLGKSCADVSLLVSGWRDRR
jgi:hypothetical protein